MVAARATIRWIVAKRMLILSALLIVIMLISIPDAAVSPVWVEHCAYVVPFGSARIFRCRFEVHAY
jgi:hypothetical protein